MMDKTSLKSKTYRNKKHCCLCGPNTKTESSLSLFKFPIEEERFLKWKAFVEQEIVVAHNAQYCHEYLRLCSFHFQQNAFSGMNKNRLKRDAVPTLRHPMSILKILAKGQSQQAGSVTLNNSQPAQPKIILTTLPLTILQNGIFPTNFAVSSGPCTISNASHESRTNESYNDVINPIIQLNEEEEELQDSETMKVGRCRTCLNVIDESTSNQITKDCFSDRTIKQAIILLVPKLVSTLDDNEVVCDDCVKILESTMKFIAKCLQVEEVYSEMKDNEYGTDEFSTEIQLNEDIPKIETANSPEVIITEHDYCNKIIPTSNDSDDDDKTSLFNYNVNECSDDDFIPPVEEPSKDPLSEVEVKSETVKKTRQRTGKGNMLKRKHKVYKKREKVYSCSTCTETFVGREEYDAHLEIHPPLMCEICGRTFIRMDSLKAHLCSHNSRDSFICDICAKGFKDPGTLRVHLRTHSDNRKTYPCDLCDKSFMNSNGLRLHKKYIHDNIFTATCEICGALCRTKGTLDKHIRLIHNKEKPYQCNICYKRFGRADYLRNHRFCHTGGRPQRKTMANRSKPNTSRPRTTRPGEKPDQQGLVRRLNLRYRVEENGEPVPCKFCGRWYQDMVRLKRHLQTHLKRYPCEFCPLSFASKALTKRHAKIHKDDSLRCNTCWKRFETKEALEEHAACHNKPRHSCDLCGKKFNRLFLLNHHKLTDHKISDDDKMEEIIYNSLVEVSSEVNKVETEVIYKGQVEEGTVENN